MKYDGIVIYSDLDGTLLNSRREISKENMGAITSFITQGGRFGVATGRMEQTTNIKFPDLNLNLPSIFFNGAMIYETNTDKVLFKAVMSGNLKPVLQGVMSKYPKVCCEISIHGKSYVFNPNDTAREMAEREGFELEEAPWDDIPGEWLKVLFIDEHETLKIIKADLEGLNRTDLNIVFSEREFLDIMDKSASKGAALKRLESIYSDNWRFLVTIGDNDNDLEMIQVADLGIAVENATPAIKKASDYIIKNHNTPCIPQVLELLESYTSKDL